MATENDWVINVDDSNDWLKAILGNEGKSLQMQKLLLPKVPQLCRRSNKESNKECYDPMVVSIGPYHHGNSKLQSMEKFKIVLARHYVEAGTIYAMPSENEFAAACSKAKTYYTDEEPTKKFNDGDFTRMMFLDGCFILQFIIDCVPPQHKDDQQQISSGPDQSTSKMKSHDMAFVRRDLFLLENQLPFHILELLMRVKFKDSAEGLKWMDMFIQRTWANPAARNTCKDKVKNFFNKFNSPSASVAYKKAAAATTPPPPPPHLLHLMWAKLITNADAHDATANKQINEHPDDATANKQINEQPDDATANKQINEQSDDAMANKQTNEQSEDAPNGSDWHTYRSAQELKTAGIHFKPSGSHCFTDVKFEPQLYKLKAVLRLPPMTIDDSTKSLLLNLVAYEMSPSGPDWNGVTSFLCFIDSLIDLVDDVKELRHKGILLNFLGSDQQVADLFNEIANDLVPDSDAYKSIKKEIEDHYRNKVKVWLAEWLHTHFSTPWTLLAFIAAIFALVLSFVQTYLALFPRT
ncbi:UPF0481 protein At3g47200-like [Cornus florida]|uniref:UPF0481 protein At3g47200-like n=1 Tax=Cornus florida TaxID=4283 RepID=UPI00289D9D74|nr:UPF0481 protein At3g47200-like [Cornus florida]